MVVSWFVGDRSVARCVVDYREMSTVFRSLFSYEGDALCVNTQKSFKDTVVAVLDVKIDVSARLYNTQFVSSKVRDRDHRPAHSVASRILCHYASWYSCIKLVIEPLKCSNFSNTKIRIIEKDLFLIHTGQNNNMTNAVPLARTPQRTICPQHVFQ